MEWRGGRVAVAVEEIQARECACTWSGEDEYKRILLSQWFARFTQHLSDERCHAAGQDALVFRWCRLKLKAMSAYGAACPLRQPHSPYRLFDHTLYTNSCDSIVYEDILFAILPTTLVSHDTWTGSTVDAAHSSHPYERHAARPQRPERS